ncbi:MAG TPA: DNA adenine methylase, partial [Vicinamibacterales bacterium]
DFVYLDPPYAPVSRTSYFTAYSSGKFNADQQAVLQQTVISIAGKGARVLLSNSFAPDISRLYEENDDVRNAGLTTRTVSARRAINSRATSRGTVLEYLITNVDAADA